MSEVTKSYAPVKQFILEHGKIVREDGKPTALSLTQGQYTTFAEKNGVEAAQLKAVAAVNKQLVNGLTLAAADVLAEDIVSAKKAGSEIDDLRVNIHVQRPDGSYKGYMIPERVGRNPRKPGESVVTHGALRLSVVTKTMIDEETFETAAAVVKAAK